MADYDTSVGIQLDDNFEKAIANAQRLVSAMSSVEAVTKKVASSIDSANKMVNTMSKLNKMDFSKMDAQIDKVVESVNQLQTKLSQINTANLIAVADALRTVMGKDMNFNLSGIEKLKEIPTMMKTLEALDSTKLGKVFTTLATQIQPFLAKLKEAREDLKNLATIANSSMGKVKTETKKAQDSVKKLGDESKKTGKKINNMFTVGNMMYFYNMSKRLFSGIGNIMGKAIDFAEIENLFSRAMGNMRGEAMQFQEKMANMFGMAMPDMMQMQATFKNMLGSLGGLSDDMSYKLSETVTKMTLDFSSLYNTSIEGAATKFQAALSKQVKFCPLYMGMYSEFLLIAGNLNPYGHGNQQVSEY